MRTFITHEIENKNYKYYNLNFCQKKFKIYNFTNLSNFKIKWEKTLHNYILKEDFGRTNG